MSMLSSVLCLKCEGMYNENRKTCIGSCGHSICEKCFDEKQSGSCSICKAEHAFDEKRFNWHAPDMVKTLLESISLTSVCNMNTDHTTVGHGLCSECKGHSNKLRICADCAIQHNLLEKSDNGGLKLSKDSSEEELLEAKILRIRSNALCADCVMDGRKHDGHQMVPLGDVQYMNDATEVLDSHAALVFLFHNIWKECDQHKYMKLDLQLYNFHCECFLIIEKLIEHLENDSSADSELLKPTEYMDQVYGSVWHFRIRVEDSLKEASNYMEIESSTEEKLEWKKTIEQLECIKGFYDFIILKGHFEGSSLIPMDGVLKHGPSLKFGQPSFGSDDSVEGMRLIFKTLPMFGSRFGQSERDKEQQLEKPKLDEI
ncbi:hypothetical protein GCK72_013326 [Caenorhabditis remanei]|uniref:RING-type domain-containing protein n=1 Tax=Caenorhabditis remanei TaxID=31234 RepID=A0A6A5GR73_CAERE|nr:hypothetical protein GCK72_013326 [Caenorhabditis remanei]KAF1756872.1 hypothetical protein GCK72_013326 [Caenorhabditis remanei]